jgi:murein DD-endopeptidase MepM/ murein hydrolase activator NlpD
MAAGTQSYEKPQYGSLAGALGEKIGSAIGMAATARRKQNEEIEELESLEVRTPEENERLADLKAQKTDQGKGFFAKKALGTEFGGDMKRRTMGFFQQNPPEQNDPSLTKQKRFEALVAAQSTGVQRVTQTELDLSGAGYKEQGALGKFAASIAEKFNILGTKVDQLKQKEDQDKTPVLATRLTSSLSSVKSFFTKNSSLEEKQVNIAKQQLQQQKESADDAEVRATSLATSSRRNSTGLSPFDNDRDGLGLGGGKGGRGGILGRLLGFGGRLLGRRLLGMRGGRNKMPRMSRSRAYTRPIGPQPMGSSSPWARSRGQSGGINGFMPRLQSRALPGRRKLASGGILDNPTAVSGSSAIIPKGKMTSAVKTNPENQKKSTPFAKALQLPTMAAGALMLSTAGSVIKNMGGVGAVFRPVVQRLFTPAAAAFGIPSTLVGSFFGGPSQAKGLPMNGINSSGGQGKTGSGNATNASSTPGSRGISPGAMVTNGGSVGDYSSSDGFGMREAHPITGKRTMHYGIDYNIPEGKEIALKKGGKVSEVMAPNTGSQVSGIVTIDHDDGTSSRYVHLSSVNVSNGETVQVGTMVGKVGGVPGNPGGGGSTGAHLHWEYYKDGTVMDGAGLADSYFTVGLSANGTITPSVTPSISPASTPPAAPAASSTPGMGSPVILPGITMPGTPSSMYTMPTESTQPSSPWATFNPLYPITGSNF